MGSWNGTCGLSNLPIQEGDKILLFVLAPTKSHRDLGGGFSYPTGRYTPIGLPIHGEYNDYGGIEHITKNGDVMFDFLTKQGQYQWQPKEDVELVPANIEELLNDVIERGNCANYDFMLIREDILDGLKAQNVAAFAAYAPQFPAFTDVYTSEVKRVKAEEGADYKPMLHNRFAEMDIQEKLEYNNVFANVLMGHDFYSLKPFIRMTQASPETTIHDSIIDVLYMDDVLSSLRKFWSVQSGAGNGNNEHDAHMALCQTMQDVCAKRDRESEDYGDE